MDTEKIDLNNPKLLWVVFANEFANELANETKTNELTTKIKTTES